MSHPLVVAISGGSGAIYSTRLLEILLGMGQDIHLTISPPAVLVLRQELGLSIDLDRFELDQLLPSGTSCFDHCPATAGDTTPVPQTGKVTYHHYTNFMASIASGSCLTSGMVICPCSGSTLSAVVTGASNNLIHRAADVHLKEGRRLVVVPRETPLSQVALDNMKRAGDLGATILPAMPGWYHGVQSAKDLVDFVVSRILDQVHIDNTLIRRWGDQGRGA